MSHKEESQTETAPPEAAKNLQNLESQVFAIDRSLPRQAQQAAFLQTLKIYGFLYRTCAVCGIPESTLHDWRRASPEFDAQIDRWLQHDMPDALESAAFFWATQGGVKGYKHLELLLKAKRPDEYKDRLQIDMSVTVSAQLSVARGIADVRRARLKALSVPETPVFEGEFEVLEEGSVEV